MESESRLILISLFGLVVPCDWLDSGINSADLPWPVILPFSQQLIKIFFSLKSSASVMLEYRS